MSSETKELEAEEEVYIFVEFDESVKIEKFRNIHVLGIDTKTPLVQLDSTFFSGAFESSLGTYLFFEEDVNAQTNDPLFEKLPEKSLKYLTKTGKTLKSEHVYVKVKEGTEDPTHLKPDKMEEISAVIFTSVPDAVDKFKKDWMMTYPDLFKSEK